MIDVAKRLFVCMLLLTACSGLPRVSRVDSDKSYDLSGYWNDADVKIVANSLIGQCLSSGRIAEFVGKTGRLPVIIMGSFKNKSDEHIDTGILTKRFEAAILNSGKADFVASANEREEIRRERIEQQSFASENSAKRLANETAADFIFQGTVRTIVDSNGPETVRTYYVNAELIDVETHRKIWVGDDSSIKKLIKRSSIRY